MQGGDGGYSGQQTEETATGCHRMMVTTESVIMVVGAGTWKASNMLAAGLVTKADETDRFAHSSHEQD